ncbi:hypothetical protein IMSAGC013_01992 [Lachnospiraceae bacterium]|nr:hypothetical protein IMSAGC013_01992 [Lachnospiraceae bacterium]
MNNTDAKNSGEIADNHEEGVFYDGANLSGRVVKTEIRILFLYMVRRPRFYYLPFQNTDQKGCKTHRKSHAEPERLYRCRFP